MKTARLFIQVVKETSLFYLTLFYYWYRKGTYSNCPYFTQDIPTKVHLYSIALNIELWDKPHYRNGTYQSDMVKNLRNLAIPGTGICLSWFCRYKWSLYLFILIGYPIICVFAAIKAGYPSFHDILCTFKAQLLSPDDWFSFWRLNCCLASYHSLITRDNGYEMEDKWKLLVKAKSLGIAVTPWLDVSEIIVKDKNEEGGLGISVFKNAMHGGDWIIQERLDNAPFMAHFLPKDAPLSTFRVITASKHGLKQEYDITNGSPKGPIITALSCVFRAGLSGAMTDHESILFDVDMKTGLLGRGTTNNHWYQIGLKKILTTPWVSYHNTVHHPDTAFPVTGHEIPDIDHIIHICTDAHLRLLPNVPLAGWDVACTSKGIYLLEVNLSCNFFRGTFDHAEYFKLVDEHFTSLENYSKRERSLEDKKEI